MRRKISFIVPVIIVCVINTFYSCKYSNDDKEQVMFDCSEVQKLTTIEQKKEFLLDIWNSDQSIRSSGNNTSYEKMNKVDGINLKKIECYLATFDYPDISWDYRLNLAPYIVIHHSSSANEKRRNFTYLRKAYNAKQLKVGDFAFYLDRLYSKENGERFDMGSSYKEEDRVEQLIKVLNLE